MWKTGDPEMATPKRVRTYRPKHSDTSLSREWKINMANKKNGFFMTQTCSIVASYFEVLKKCRQVYAGEKK